MTRALSLLCSVAVGAVLSAQAVAPQAPAPVRDAVAAPSAGTASVSGVVVDDQGKPMRRVSVVFEASGRGGRVAITDDQGKFVAANLPAAQYTVRADRPGFPPVEYGAKRPGRPGAGLTVKDGDKIDGITLRMQRGAVITGRVFDDRGRPMAGAMVTAYVVQTSLGGEFEIRPVVRAGSSYPSTDDRGVFRFYGLAAGEYIVGVAPFFQGLGTSVRIPTDAEVREAFGSAQQRASRAISTDTKPVTAGEAPLKNYAKVYFGDVTDPAASTRVRVAAGEERSGVDLHLTLEPHASIIGTVVGPDPMPVIELTLMTARGPNAGVIVVRPGVRDGAINFTNQAPGDYLLTARTIGATPAMWAEQPITITDRDVTGVRLELQPTMTMSGRAVFGGTALPPPDPAKVIISANPVAGRDRSVAGGPDPLTPAFDFTFPSVMPGRFRLAAAVRDTVKPGAPAWTLARVMLGDRDVTDLPVDVVGGQPLPPLTVTFTDTPSELSGTIVTADGKPGSDFFVVAVASDERYWVFASRRIKSTRPDANGRYVFPGLPPGTYRIAATTDLEQGDLQNLTFLRDLVGASAEVTVGVGEKKVFDLKLGGLPTPQPSTPALSRRR